MRWLKVMGLAVVTLLGCGEPGAPPICDETTCAGCCDASGRCDQGGAATSCGARGQACVACEVGAGCVAGACGTAGGGDAGSDGGEPDGGGDGGGSDGGQPDAGADAGATPQWLLEPGLTAQELGVLVNDADPQSVAIAARYVQARGIPPRNVVHLSFSGGAATMPAATFAPLKATADALALDAGLQAWAITWTQPYRVDCMSIGTAFAVGFDAGFCSTPCAPTTALPTYDDEGRPDAGRSAHRPWDSFGVRPTMMLASGADAGAAFALIDRGVAADGTFPTGDGWFFRTTDAARSVRWTEWRLTTMPQWTPDGGLALFYSDATDGGPSALVDAGSVLFYFQSLASVPSLATNTYLPGAVADHLTSFGGQVPTSGQMSALRWLEAGATASYGTVVEPCNYTQKFPNTTVLLSHYYRGEPVLEAYWKSVQMPGEGLFVGEPLARPWGGARTGWEPSTRTSSLTTTALKPGLVYAIEAGPTPSGPWTEVRGGVTVPRFQRVTLTVPGATQAWYRVVRR